MKAEESKGVNAPKRRGFPAWLAIILVALMVLGHVSNLVSLKSSERAVFRWLREGEGRGYRLRYSKEMDPLQWTMLFRLYEGDCTRFDMVDAEAFRKRPMPTCRIGSAEAVCPFVTCVDFGETLTGLAGAGGKVYVFNLFRKSWVVYFDCDWVS